MKATEKQAKTSKKIKKSKKKLPIYYKFGGRPTKYKPIYCKKIIEYFDIKPTRKEKVVKIIKGFPVEIEVEKANPIPLFDMFAIEVCNVDRTTLHNWCDEHPEFFLAYRKAKAMQKKLLMYQCSYGFITPSYAVFLTKALTDLNDVSSVDITSGGEKVESFNISDYLKELKDKNVDELHREAERQISNN